MKGVATKYRNEKGVKTKMDHDEAVKWITLLGDCLDVSFHESSRFSTIFAR